MTSDARQRMIQSAALLVREQGIEATSFTDVLEASGAPRGSIYHHFPGGKAELVEEATRWAGSWIAAGLTRALDAGDPVAALREFVATWRVVLTDSDFAAGCPVVAASVEGDANPGARDAAATAFADWVEATGAALERNGLDPERARSLATLMITAIEGAIVLSRAQRSIAPLERVAGELESLVAPAIEG